MFTERKNRVFAPEPHTLYIDGLRQVPDLLRRVDGVGVVGMHDAGIVEDDVDAAPGIEMLDGGSDVGFFGDVTGFDFDAGGGGDEGLQLGEGFFEGRGRNIRHEDGGALFGEQDGCFETDSTKGGGVLGLVM